MKRFITIILLGISITSFAQVLNDDCQFATFISDIDGYCSEPAEFTNINAMPDPVFSDVCFLNYLNGVWFSFVPKEPAINVRVFGTGIGLNTLQFPKMALFSSCGNFLTCSPGKSQNSDEFVISGLTIGQVYYLMVESAENLEGTFQLCIDDFTPTPSPESDCDKAVVLCSKEPFSVESLNSQGDNPNEANGSCIGGELASSWYVWECDQSGTLTMELTPANLGIEEIVDDLDFVVFELPGGIKDCNNRIELRCMGSGANTFDNGQIQPVSTWAICNRATGMAEGETDFIETGGCLDVSNNYVAPLDMVAGTAYGILINNFANNGLGFSIEFGGTGTFVGPEADFEVDAVAEFECDKTITFTDLSDPGVDPIINYTWNFGAGATPSTASGTGTFETIYDSFGEKVAALTLESQRGCLVTKVVEFYVEPCCQDTSTLEVDAFGVDVECFGDMDGQLVAEGSSGSPEYQYSIDGINFQPSPRFLNLAAGTYNVTIVDKKGCMAVTDTDIFQPTLTSVDAGQDSTVDLGYSIILDAMIDSDYFIDSIFWSPLDSFLNCTECLDPEIIPPGNTTYTITVVDENGCTASDEILLLVNTIREVYFPNVFSPNGDDTNDFFNIFGGPGVEGIEFLKIYDRWGNLMYDGQPTINDRFQGWDGFFNGKPVNPGVYAWMADIRFIDDGTIINYSGDVTVVR
ncbi:MAG: gliding motility-associated C-terminal domain-containing protein [Saprospiraceae bacterium]|nr:gliding motility-associated C-terminal domain-containing protein [Saprospiraceae bacterium]